jgi:mannose-6-phosphate isomerase
VAFDGNRVARGPLAGQTLRQVVASHAPHLGDGFPLLIKLLDCADWLSVQVHPNDEQAVQLEGADKRGKTEAWHVLDCAEGAKLIAGIKPGITQHALAQAIQNGKVMECVQSVVVRPGDTVFMPAGTIHALGPGMLIYEVQQASDITYRVYDWDRPATANRPLHISKSLVAANASQTGQITPADPQDQHEQRRLVTCAYFDLDLLKLVARPFDVDAAPGAMQVFTVIDGSLEVVNGAERVELGKNETLCYLADGASCRLTSHGKAWVLRASIPNG